MTRMILSLSLLITAILLAGAANACPPGTYGHGTATAPKYILTPRAGTLVHSPPRIGIVIIHGGGGGYVNR